MAVVAENAGRTLVTEFTSRKVAEAKERRFDGSTEDDPHAQDEHDAAALYDLLENEVKPLYFTRDENGIPVGWIAYVRQSLRTLAPMFSAARMVGDYVDRIYTTKS